MVPNLSEDTRIRRSGWSSDPKKRLKELAEVMPAAIRDYFGAVASISSALNVIPEEVSRVITESEELSYLAKQYQAQEIALVEENLAKQAREGTQVTAIKLYLTNKAPERWSDRVSVDTVGSFSVPSAKDAPPESVLKPKGRKKKGKE